MKTIKYYAYQITVSFIPSRQPVDNTIRRCIIRLNGYIEIIIIKQNLEFGSLSFRFAIVWLILSETTSPGTRLPRFIIKNSIDDRGG